MSVTANKAPRLAPKRAEPSNVRQMSAEFRHARPNDNREKDRQEVVHADNAILSMAKQSLFEAAHKPTRYQPRPDDEMTRLPKLTPRLVSRTMAC